MNLDPRIGLLSSGKFYTFPNGPHKPEFIGTLEEVEARLGLPESCAEEAQPVKLRSLRDFEVTVKPKVVAHSGGGWSGASQTFGEYTVRVSARTHSDAITKVRQERNEQEGRHGIKANFRAKRI
ncbi:hypothetical protein [Ralstonia sp. ASV6]|uniref:hypothetical protein n=1 Tax=Ralstonia sp. ASV6 TaxID=2795124 RepID=UPI0018EC1B4C|nr:hypothetical protein [Ralstonia sp. ASV6]